MVGLPISPTGIRTLGKLPPHTPTQGPNTTQPTCADSVGAALLMRRDVCRCIGAAAFHVCAADCCHMFVQGRGRWWVVPPPGEATPPISWAADHSRLHPLCQACHIIHHGQELWMSGELGGRHCPPAPPGQRRRCSCRQAQRALQQGGACNDHQLGQLAVVSRHLCAVQAGCTRIYQEIASTTMLAC